MVLETCHPPAAMRPAPGKLPPPGKLAPLGRPPPPSKLEDEVLELDDEGTASDRSAKTISDLMDRPDLIWVYLLPTTPTCTVTRSSWPVLTTSTKELLPAECTVEVGTTLASFTWAKVTMMRAAEPALIPCEPAGSATTSGYV